MLNGDCSSVPIERQASWQSIVTCVPARATSVGRPRPYAVLSCSHDEKPSLTLRPPAMPWWGRHAWAWPCLTTAGQYRGIPGLAGAWHRNCLRLSAKKEVWLMAHNTHIYGEIKNKNDGVKIRGKVKHMSWTRF